MQLATPPEALYQEMEIPSRDGVSTVGDLVRLVKEDEAAMKLKNADLRSLCEFYRRMQGDVEDVR